MPVTVQLNDALAAQLQRKAAARQLSLQEFTLHLLDGALGQIEAADQWAAQNRRRLHLIHQSCTTGLSAQEQAELQALQAAVDQRLEPIDDGMLHGLEQWQNAAECLPEKCTGQGR